MRHLQRGSGQIVAIEVGNYVQQKNIRQQTQGNPTASAASNVIGDNDWGRQFVSAKIALERQGHSEQKATRSYTNSGSVANGTH